MPPTRTLSKKPRKPAQKRPPHRLRSLSNPPPGAADKSTDDPRHTDAFASTAPSKVPSKGRKPTRPAAPRPKSGAGRRRGSSKAATAPVAARGRSRSRRPTGHSRHSSPLRHTADSGFNGAAAGENPEGSLPDPEAAARVLQRFARVWVILRGRLSCGGALALLVEEEINREEVLHLVRVKAARRTLSRFFTLAGERRRERKNNAHLRRGLIRQRKWSFASSSEGDEYPAEQSDALLALAPQLPKQCAILEAVLLAKTARGVFEDRMNALRWRAATKSMEHAWLNSESFQLMQREAAWRSAEAILLRHETLERRDLVRRYLLDLIATHQAFYNHPLLLGTGHGVRREELTRFIAAFHNKGAEEASFNLGSGWGSSEGLSSGYSPTSGGTGGAYPVSLGGDGDGYGSTTNPTVSQRMACILAQEAEIRSYDRRLFFSKEERALLAELGLLNPKAGDGQLVPVGCECVNGGVEGTAEDEAEMWAANEEQVRLFDRLLADGAITAAHAQRSLIASYSFPGKNALPSRPLRRAARMHVAAADATRARIPQVLVAAQQKDGALAFVRPTEGGGLSPQLLSQIGELAMNNDTLCDPELIEVEPRPNTAPAPRPATSSVSATTVKKAHLHRHAAEAAPQLCTLGRIAVPCSFTGGSLYGQYAALLDARDSCGPVLDADGDGAPPIPTQGSTATLIIGGKCDGVNQLFLDPVCGTPTEGEACSSEDDESDTDSTGVTPTITAPAITSQSEVEASTSALVTTELSSGLLEKKQAMDKDMRGFIGRSRRGIVAFPQRQGETGEVYYLADLVKAACDS